MAAAHSGKGNAPNLHPFKTIPLRMMSTINNNDLLDLLPIRRRRLLRLFNPLGGRGSRDEDEPLVQQQQMLSNKHRMYAACLGIVFAWISLATFFYSWYYKWPIPQSFFYAVDAGMSIGFCTDVAETDVASRAFTIIHILLGASCVGGALILMVSNVLEGVANQEAAVFKLILEKDSFKKAFLGVNINSPTRSLMTSPMNWLQFNRNGNGILSYEEFRKVLRNNGLEVSEEEFQLICNYYDPQVEGFIRYDQFASKFEGTQRILAMSQSAHYKAPLLRAAAKTLDAIRSLFVNEYYRIYLIFVLWVAMGITWGMVNQGWDPITATHFAVSALATGGLTAPPVDKNGILPTGPALFCGFYCIIGIPLMALTLGLFAGVLVERYIVEEELAAITRPLTKSEFLFASKSLCSTDNALHLSDYIVLQLMRQGKINLESFEFMKRQYQILDSRLWLKSVDPD